MFKKSLALLAVVGSTLPAVSFAEEASPLSFVGTKTKEGIKFLSPENGQDLGKAGLVLGVKKTF